MQLSVPKLKESGEEKKSLVFSKQPAVDSRQSSVGQSISLTVGDR